MLFLHSLNGSIENFNESNIHTVKTHPQKKKKEKKNINILEIQPLWNIENNEVICVKTRVTIDKMFYKCLIKGSKVKLSNVT